MRGMEVKDAKECKRQRLFRTHDNDNDEEGDDERKTHTRNDGDWGTHWEVCL